MADDHHLILDAVGAMMRTEFEVKAVDSAPAFLEAVEYFRPDVIVLDVNLSGSDGFAAARSVLAKHPEMRIVFLSMYTEPTYMQRAAQIGAKAYLSKRSSSTELVEALHAVLQGETLLPERAEGEPSGAGGVQLELTARQVEVLRLIAGGSSAKDIANRLNISVRTAEFHRAAIMQRLNLRSTAQMTRYALANNLG